MKWNSFLLIIIFTNYYVLFNIIASEKTYSNSKKYPYNLIRTDEKEYIAASSVFWKN